MNKNPLVSVVVTVFNTEVYVERCFQCLINQTYKNLEIIVVNNGSTGNIKEIVNEYSTSYLEPQFKIINLPKNIGLFSARLKGIDNAHGDYIAFIDSDDRVSLDYFRKMLETARDNSADIVMADFCNEFDDGRVMSYNLADLGNSHLVLFGQDVFDFYMKQSGLSFNIFAVWNKLYSRQIMFCALPALHKIDTFLVVGEDIVYSTVFFSLAKCFCTVSNVRYFHFSHPESASGIDGDKDKMIRNLKDIHATFEMIKKYLSSAGLLNNYLKEFENARNLHFRIWYEAIQNTNLSRAQKHYCAEFAMKLFHKSSAELKKDKDDSYFWKVQTQQNQYLEHLAELVTSPDYDIISFDIFDTLLYRPFFEPQDLFYYMDQPFHKRLNSKTYGNFHELRIQAENLAREKARLRGNEEIKFSEIYNELEYTIGIAHDICESLRILEMNLEMKFCYPRNTAHDVYNMACLSGKRIICISDMYLDKKFLCSLLHKNGFNIRPNDIFVSSEFLCTKESGKLYKKVLSSIGITPNRILHIGDNYSSDFLRPQSMQIGVYHFPRAMDIFKGQHTFVFGGDLYPFISENMYTVENTKKLEKFLCTRCMLALIANHLFDNPYNSIHEDTAFNASAYEIGYCALGMHLLALSLWLISSVEKNGYRKIHFVSRDGYLPKKAFDMVSKGIGKVMPTEYLQISREAIIPLLICDLKSLFSILDIINYKEYSPKRMIELLLPLLKDNSQEKWVNEIKNAGFVYENNFNSLNNYARFANFLVDNMLDETRIINYRNTMRVYFADIIDKKDCIFDIGYTAKIETTLSMLLGYGVDGHMLYCRNDNAKCSSVNGDFVVHKFYDFEPRISSTIREFPFSEFASSFQQYQINGDKVIKINSSIVNPKEFNFQSEYVLTLIEKGALDYISDYIKHFSDYLSIMDMSNIGASLPWEFYLTYSSSIDRSIFMASYFVDNLNENRIVNFCDYWEQQSNAQLIPNWYSTQLIQEKSIWKKAIYYMLFDKKTFKEKVKKRLQRHPVMYRIARRCYVISRNIYHKIK